MMPLLCFDLIQGRSENQIKRILDVTHQVMVNAFSVPEPYRRGGGLETWCGSRPPGHNGAPALDPAIPNDR
jgi:hypothetical protein